MKNRQMDLWKNQMMLHKTEGEGKRDSNIVTDLNTLAEHIGISLIWKGKPKTEDREALSLFLLIARETMMNAVKHAQAEHLWIEVENEQSGENIKAVFINDGKNVNHLSGKQVVLKISVRK